LFDLRAYRQLNRFVGEKILVGITSVDFSRSGQIFFAGYDDYKCCRYCELKKKKLLSRSFGFSAIRAHKSLNNQSATLHTLQMRGTRSRAPFCRCLTDTATACRVSVLRRTAR
jgi:hypothetical protein